MAHRLLAVKKKEKLDRWIDFSPELADPIALWEGQDGLGNPRAYLSVTETQ